MLRRVSGTIDDKQMKLLFDVASHEQGYIESLIAIKGKIDSGDGLNDNDEATVKEIQVKVKLFQDTLNQVLLNSTATATATGGCRQRRKKTDRKKTSVKDTSKQKRKRKKRSRQRKKNKTIKKISL